MTAITHTRPHFLHGTFAALAGVRARFAENRRRNAAYNKTFNELSAMTSRDLADIGLNRFDIPRIAAEAADMK
ncbi:DUF1127 domain-containing protein [Roseobacter ponti]|uniref:DUF1127 domain-containing protein n=1 Tax=Roseobacter ponti TaxID=1891787 RepID=A0A858SUG7_9RHOB|nr:DUF1127 domain-containing protein [Roseobacter ponti]QJF52325.1 DUF1127 domain-containing protein [Roseobacter ponti]